MNIKVASVVILKRAEGMLIPSVLLLILLYLVLIVTAVISITLSIGGFLLGNIDFGIAWLGPSLGGSVGVIGLGLLWKKRVLNKRGGLV